MVNRKPTSSVGVAEAKERDGIIAAGAFTLEDLEPANANDNREPESQLRALVMEKVLTLQKAQVGMKVDTLNAITMSNLTKKKEELDALNPADFYHLTPDNPSQHVCIKDGRGNVLAYMFPIPAEMVNTLETSTEAIPSRKVTEKERGEHEIREWAYWSKYARHKFGNNEYMLDFDPANGWLDDNRPLMAYIEEMVRVLLPIQYAAIKAEEQLTNVGIDRGQKGKDQKRIELELERITLAGLFTCLALNIDQTEDGVRHLDTSDASNRHNCVVPFGRDWQGGGELLLWDIKRRVTIPRGYACLFLGCSIHHNVIGIEGIRSSVDFFNDQGSKFAAERKKAEMGRAKNFLTAEEKRRRKKQGEKFKRAKKPNSQTRRIKEREKERKTREKKEKERKKKEKRAGQVE